MRLKRSECEKAGFGASKEADWLTNIHTRHLNLLLNHFNILLCIVWQLLVISNVCYIALPARQSDVLHLSTNAATLEPTI